MLQRLTLAVAAYNPCLDWPQTAKHRARGEIHLSLSPLQKGKTNQVDIIREIDVCLSSVCMKVLTIPENKPEEMWYVIAQCKTADPAKTFHALLDWKCIFCNFIEFQTLLHKEVFLAFPYFSLVLLLFHRLWTKFCRVIRLVSPVH